MLRYHNTDIRPAVGDRVKYVEQPEIMVVEEVIDTREQMARWGVDEAGLMIVGGVVGRAFETLEEDGEIVFVGRRADGGA